jgi:hypothetical protein
MVGAGVRAGAGVGEGLDAGVTVDSGMEDGVGAVVEAAPARMPGVGSGEPPAWTATVPAAANRAARAKSAAPAEALARERGRL